MFNCTKSNFEILQQDAIGGYNYGYSTDTSSKQEVRTPDGIVSGTYSYVDANGIVQTVNYVSDAEGFKVAATNLPKAPVAAPAPAAVAEVVAPAVVAVAEPTLKVAEDQDDMEVIGVEDVAAVPTVPYVAPASYYAPHHVAAPYSPYAYGYAPHQAPVAPVVQHTPAHAPVAYYAPTHAYAQAAVPVAAPEATVVPVAAPASTHSQFHAQVKCFLLPASGASNRGVAFCFRGTNRSVRDIFCPQIPQPLATLLFITF